MILNLVLFWIGDTIKIRGEYLLNKEGDKMCGVFGVSNCKKAAENVYLGLHYNQHRAQDYAGIVSSDGVNLYRHIGKGIVQDAFTQADLNALHGKMAIGHIRYPTIPDKKEKEDDHKQKAQPLTGSFKDREVALVHNGNIFNCKELLKKIKKRRLKSAIDSELILRLFCESKRVDDFRRVFDAVHCIKGTYSLIFLYDDTMIAVRDPHGNRPLALGKNGRSWFLSSETVAFDGMGVKYVRDVAPGEILKITKKGLQSMYFNENGLYSTPQDHKKAYCIFELIYYSHPASFVFGQYVDDFQAKAGDVLFGESKVEADCVVGVPDSATFHSEGVSRASGIPLKKGLVRSHYIGRTFIEPFQQLRDIKVRKKFMAMKRLVKGKKIILVDDSIFRLTTLNGVVKLLKEAGATEIHGLIASPPIIRPCHYGIDVPTQKELIASHHSLKSIRRKSGLASLKYLSIEGLKSLVPTPDDFCYACMTGDYPI